MTILNAKNQILEIEQGSPEWHALRKTKITATDAPVIMGVSPWKTRIELYHEKKSNQPPMPPNARMKRGTDLEPIARDHFNKQSSFRMRPCVVLRDWLMASLDGRDSLTGYILEVKCPGEKDHAIAISGKVPDHYYPQLQHQIYVCDTSRAYFYSWIDDYRDPACVIVERNDEYIKKMLIEEEKFYQCLLNDTPPLPSEDEYILRDDPIWLQPSNRLIDVRSQIEKLQVKKSADLLKRRAQLKRGGDLSMPSPKKRKCRLC